MTKNNDIIPGKLYQFKTNYGNYTSVYAENLLSYVGYIKKGDAAMILTVKPLKFQAQYVLKVLTTEGIIGHVCIDLRSTTLTMVTQ
jgi:hypothetical protein